MSGQSQSSQKGGTGQSPYGYQPFSFGQQGYGNPAQQGSYFSNGGSSRPQFGGGMMDTGSQFGSPFTGNYGNLFIPANNVLGGPSGGGSYGAPQGGYKPAPYNPANDVLGSGGSSGGGGYMTPQQYAPGAPSSGFAGNGSGAAQQNAPNPYIGNQPNQNGLVFTNGQYGFGNGSLAQIAPGTAAFLGYRDNGQGQWVNAQGQVVGLSGGGGGGGMLK